MTPRLGRLIAIGLFLASPTLQSVANAQTRLRDGVLKYERSQSSTPWFWQYLDEKFGWMTRPRPFNKSVAFLVGVGSYRNLSPQLRYVKSDVDELRQFLLADGGFDTVYVALDGVATATLVDNYMYNVLREELTENDRLLFYFSGHGTDLDGTGYLQFGGATQAYDRDQYLEVTRTEQWSRRLRAKHVLFLLDACNAGLGYAQKASDGEVDEGLVAQFSGDGSRNVLTAGFGREKAFQTDDGNQKGYSVFTRAFLDAIRQTPSTGGFLTLTEIMADLERRVAQFSRGNPSRRMTPRRWDLSRDTDRDRGTFVFINPRVKTPTIPTRLRSLVSITSKAGEPPEVPVPTPEPSRTNVVTNRSGAPDSFASLVAECPTQRVDREPGVIIQTGDVTFTDGRSLYVLDQRRVLTRILSSDFLTNTRALSIAPDGNVFVATSACGRGLLVKINPTTGTQTPIAASSGGTPVGLTVEPGGRTALLADENSRGYGQSSRGALLRVDLATGRTTMLTVFSSTDVPSGVTVHPRTGDIFLAARGLYRLDRDDPATPRRVDVDGVRNARALAFGGDGNLYVADSERSTVLRVDLASVTSTPFGQPRGAFSNGWIGLAGSHDGRQLLVGASDGRVMTVPISSGEPAVELWQGASAPLSVFVAVSGAP